MAGRSTLSFRVPEDKAQLLEDLAKATDRPKAWLLEQALDAYLETQSWHVARIERGLSELRAGQGIAHEEIAAWLESWGSDEERDPPG
ncbi:MAG: ribbon-helix-helix protein, CopG family [Dongiaceae bacterium]